MPFQESLIAALIQLVPQVNQNNIFIVDIDGKASPPQPGAERWRHLPRQPITGWTNSETSSDDEQDELYDEAVNFVLESRRASISSVQRKLRIGYNRAARLIEAMEAAGLVSEMNTNGTREVLVPKR